MLNNMDCSNGGTIQLAHMSFKKDRIKVAEALEVKALEGCTVELNLRDNKDTDDVLPAMQHASVCYVKGIHHKYMIARVDYFTGGAWRSNIPIVVGGSQNLTNASLHKDEITVRVTENDELYGAYADNFAAMPTLGCVP
jgi:hypothetical protein